LSMTLQVLGFADWFQRHGGGAALLSSSACAEVSTSLNLEIANSQEHLLEGVKRGLLRLEAEVNNVGEETPSGLSMQKAPVDRLLDYVREGLPGKKFFFLFDEYENFSPYQQRVVNTLIKHADERYSFKIGVRELGFRTRSTLNAEEQLISPADYVRISIAEKLTGEKFRSFASDVCNSRLALVGTPGDRGIPDVTTLLPRLAEDEEAAELGAAEIVRAALDDLDAQTTDIVVRFTHARLLDQLVVVEWSKHHGLDLESEIRDFLSGGAEWKNRVNNYGYALLFTLQRGRGRGGIQKYYAGWDVLVGIAAGNIRYVLELVEQTLLLHIREGRHLGQPVSARTQTVAAQGVGRKNLTELEGLSVHGAQLTRLVLGLGRVFELLALQPLGHTPEINEFELADPGEMGDGTNAAGRDVDDLLRAAVVHLALLRYPGNKLSNAPSDTRDFDYRLHPIFSAAFGFSHRHKRKLALTGAEVLGLVRAPKQTIPAILKRHNRADNDEPLPDQLALFERYFSRD
jgi:hypothetical protein